jgi:hypothetical protein
MGLCAVGDACVLPEKVANKGMMGDWDVVELKDGVW